MDKQFISDVAKNIKKYREMKKLSQMALAAEANIAVATVGMIETAKNDITLSKINAIAKALDIPAYKLLVFNK